eukprot:166490-Prorocentrum_minimum.AAC.1
MLRNMCGCRIWEGVYGRSHLRLCRIWEGAYGRAHLRLCRIWEGAYGRAHLCLCRIWEGVSVLKGSRWYCDSTSFLLSASCVRVRKRSSSGNSIMPGGGRESAYVRRFLFTSSRRVQVLLRCTGARAH